MKTLSGKVNQWDLTEIEKSCFDFLQEKEPELAFDYMKSVQEARKKILFKLASAMLREDIIGLYTNSISLKKIGSVIVMGLDRFDGKWESLLPQLEKTPFRENVDYFTYYFNEQLFVFPVEKEYAFGRVVLTDEIWVISEEETKVIESASQLLGYFRPKLPGQSKVLADELENGTANYALALSHFNKWKREMRSVSGQMNVKSTVQFAKHQAAKKPDWSPSLFFEQFVLEGHHLHPGCKTKTGLKPEEVYCFSPEFRQSMSICFVAVRKDYLLTAEMEKQVIEKSFPDMADDFRARMQESSLNPEHYQLLPVHEWQYQNVLPSMYAAEITAKIVVLLDGMKEEGGASSSFRTIWPKREGSPALKLAVNSQMTSTVRSISTQTAMNATEFTKMMNEIMSKEECLKNFLPVNEIAGYAFKSENKEQTRNLTVVARENMDEKLNVGEVAIPGCSFYNLSPITGKPLISEILDEYCFGRDKKEYAKSFFEKYLSLVIPGYLTLMTKYGVALEGHLQNSVAVFKDGKPTRFFFRDWGGARIDESRLNEQGIHIDFHPGSVSIAQNTQELRDKAFYTIFQNHLSELIVQLCEDSGVSEKEFWLMVRTSCDRIFDELRNQGVRRASADAENLFKPVMKHKALTKMRLQPEAGYCYSLVSNPLA